MTHRVGGGDQCLPIVLRQLPVVRERGGVAGIGPGALRFERLGVCAVQSRPLAGEQVVMHGFAQQSVPETVVVVADNEDAAAGRLADRFVEPLLRQLDQARDERMRERAFRTGDDLHDVARVVAEAIETSQQQITKAIGERAVRTSGDLLDEEGHALGPLLHAIERTRGERTAGDLLGQLSDSGLVEAAEREALEQPCSGGLPDEAAHGIATAHVVGATGEEQQDAAAAEGPQQEGEDGESGLVRPVQVFDHEHLRGTFGSRFDE